MMSKEMKVMDELGRREEIMLGIVENSIPFSDEVSWIVFENGSPLTVTNSIIEAQHIVKALFFIQ